MLYSYSIRNQDAIRRAAIEAEQNGQRLIIKAHDKHTNIVSTLGHNIGHSPGVGPTYLTQFETSLKDAIERLSPSEIDVDWVIIEVRKP